MPNNKDENKKKNKLSKALLTGAALGFGLKAAHSSIGGKVLNDLAKDMSVSAKALTQELRETKFKDINATRSKEILSKSKDAFEKSHSETILRNKIGSKSSLVDHVSRTLNMVNKKSDIYGGEYNDFINKQAVIDKVVNPVVEKYTDSNELLKEDKILRKKFTDFVNRASKSIDNDINLREAYDDSLGDYTDDLGEDFLEEVTGTLRQFDKKRKESMRDYKQQYQNIEDGVIDQLKDVNSMKKAYGEESEKSGFLSRVLGDQAMTVRDVLDSEEVEFSAKPLIYRDGDSGYKTQEPEDIKAILNEFRELLPDSDKDSFDGLYVDYNILRKTESGDFYSRKASRDINDNLLKTFSESSVGTLLKTNDVISSQKAPNLLFSPKQETDYTLSLYNKDNQIKNITDSSFIKVFDKTYRATADGLEHIEELDGAKLVGKSSTQYKMLNNMTGNVTQGSKHSNKYLRWLDLGQDGKESIFEKALGGNNKDKGNTGRGILESLRHANGRLAYEDELSKEELFEIIGSYKSTNKAFEQRTKPLSKKSAEKLSKGAKDIKAKEFFRYAAMDDEELLEGFANKEISSLSDNNRYINLDLKALMSRYSRNPIEAKNYEYIKNTSSGKVSYSFEDMLRREVSKEGMLREVAGTSKANSAFELIEASGLSPRESKDAKDLMAWGMLQEATAGFNNYRGVRSLRGVEKSTEGALNFMGLAQDDANEQLHKSIKKTINELLDTDQSIIYKDTRSSKDLIKHYNNNDWAYVKKAISPKDFIEDINDESKRRSFYTQLGAGSNHFSDDITSATLTPYFFANRINEGLGRVGLGLSSESMSSTAASYANLLIKRVLPVAIGLHYLDYIDDVTEKITGTSAKGAAANSLAAIDLGARRFADATGVSSRINHSKATNPLLEYWTGSNEFQGYEERKDWYQTGHSAVRSGRFWSFGSLNEVRGGNISYYQPNYLRRAHSNWEDELLYDGFSDKWKHSILPTPTHPFSTARYLSNPYWLEEKHKDDMPYPVSGPMFEENSPWGVVLNPTIGNLIKPQKRMHKNRLGSSMVDVESLIEMRNKETMQKSKDRNKSNLFVSQSGNITANDYASTYAPTPSERVLSISNDRSFPTHEAQEGYGYGEQPGYSNEEYAPGIPEGIGYYPRDQYDKAIDIRDYIENFEEHNSEDTIEGIPVDNSGGAQLAQDSSGVAVGAIQSTNYQTMARGSESPYTLTAESINNLPAKYGNELLSNESVRSELRSINTNKQNIENALYSASKMTGIYGYAANTLLSSGNVSYRLDDAGGINSKSAKYWDQSLGGLGGQSGNLIMKLFPSDNRKVKKINPLKNTMPDWIPEHFRYGDPYKSVPKGGMRMPGKGYESLNELHSDEFGEYGAYDRHKILADVAPYSQEFKIWKDIADKTVTDPRLREEMKATNLRASEQSKKHDFYDYKFKGRKVDNERAVVEEVYGNNYFKTTGSDNIYRMAGLSVISDNFDELENYVRPGMEIRLITDADPNYKHNEDRYNSISASVMVGNKNINKELLASDVAEERRDPSAAATVGLHDASSISKGRILETITHADIPIIHDKFMRIESPFESYKRRNIYGTENQSWSHPIDSYIKPSVRRGISDGKNVALGTISFMLNIAARDAEVTDGIQRASDLALIMTNRGAAMGAVTAGLLKFSVKDIKKGKLTDFTRAGAYIGSAVNMGAYAYTRKDSPLNHTTNMGLLGASVFAKFHDSETLQKLATPIIGEASKAKMGVAGAAIGAAVGLASSSQRYSALNRKSGSTYIPKDTQKRWEIEEYFDRLEYIKYQGLFEKAARKARVREGVDVKRLIRLEALKEKEKETQREEVEAQKEALNDIPMPFSDKMRALKEIDESLKGLDSDVEIKGGKWARMALLYKDAADSTIYGLNENANFSQLLRAIPKSERDYFIEFANEKDPDKQKEISKYFSPYHRKALQISWGEKPQRQQSNASYFRNYRMPGASWSGWRPDKDLSDIKIKTIENEGMMLSDFGEYDSRLSDPEVQSADTVQYDDSTNSLLMQKNLIAALKGAGLTGVEIDMYPNNTGRIESVVNVGRIKKYKMENRVQQIFSRAL